MSRQEDEEVTTIAHTIHEKGTLTNMTQVTIVKEGANVQIGWASLQFSPVGQAVGVGDDPYSWSFDGTCSPQALGVVLASAWVLCELVT